MQSNSLTKLYLAQDRGVIGFQLLDLAERRIITILLFIVVVLPFLCFLHGLRFVP